jgi:hypothetical protein
LHVTGELAGGALVDLSAAPRHAYSVIPANVVSITADGLVTAIGNGKGDDYRAQSRLFRYRGSHRYGCGSAGGAASRPRADHAAAGRRFVSGARLGAGGTPPREVNVTDAALRHHLRNDPQGVCYVGPNGLIQAYQVGETVVAPNCST